MAEQTLKFDNIGVNKKELHKSKQPIDLMLVNIDQIVPSDKFKHDKEGFKYFIGYQKNEIVKPFCIILPQMNGYIKYFKNGGKNMSSLIKDEEAWGKHEDIWYMVENKLGIKFNSEPVNDKTYLKAKVREFNSKIKTNFLGNGVPKENIHYTCIACITIDSVMRIDKKNYPQVYLEECKYRTKKIEMSRFINTELSDSESDSEPDLKSELKSDFDSDSEYDTVH